LNVSEVIERGRNSEALLKSSTLNEAFEAVLDRISRDWLAAPRNADGHNIRDELHARANGVIALRAELTGWLNDAVKAQFDLELAEKRKGMK